MEEKNKGVGKKIAFGVIAGTIIGIITGILLAPKKGSEIRKDLKKNAEKIKKEVAKKVAKARELTKEKYEQIVGEVSGFHKRVKKIKDEDLKEIVDDLKSRWSDISKEIKNRIKK
ncbi:MAG: YtxH domain-containing protein [Patescibacteria group bacterium]